MFLEAAITELVDCVVEQLAGSGRLFDMVVMTVIAAGVKKSKAGTVELVATILVKLAKKGRLLSASGGINFGKLTQKFVDSISITLLIVATIVVILLSYAWVIV